MIKDCLDRFSEASGQKVNLNKPQVHFSPNATHDVAVAITMDAGIERTNNLGRYLGVPSIHGRVTKSVFTPIIDRFNTRLEEWKTKYLTLAGGISLPSQL